eukprot:GHVS01014478.1.p1 GENE.GHVS01014478.1~~GHVS01014478.1.p1  ORF type:complete len:193 (+),score=29.47 GHVS01014478.1:236-814(+)
MNREERKRQCKMNRSLTFSSAEIESHSNKYYDGEYEYKHVLLTKAQYVAYQQIRSRYSLTLLPENFIYRLGIQQSAGWEHYAQFGINPQVLFFRRLRQLPEDEASALTDSAWIVKPRPAVLTQPSDQHELTEALAEEEEEGSHPMEEGENIAKYYATHFQPEECSLLKSHNNSWSREMVDNKICWREMDENF